MVEQPNWGTIITKNPHKKQLFTITKRKWYHIIWETYTKQNRWLAELGKITQYIIQIKLNPITQNLRKWQKKVITTNISPLHLENGKVANTELEMPEVWHDYFASYFTHEDIYEIQEITLLNVT